MNARNGVHRHKIWIGILIVLFILGFAFGFVYYRMTAANSSKKTVQAFVVEEGSGTSQIAAELESKGLIRSANGFKIYARIHKMDGKFQAGTYNLSPSMKVSEIANIIEGGKVAAVSVTITEGMNEFEIAQLLAKKGLVDKDKFIDAAENTDFSKEFPFLKNAQKGKYRLEGYLYPETYSIPEGSSEEDIIRIMLKQFQKVYQSLSIKKKAAKMGYSVNEIMTVASIVEKESGNKKDRPTVASVIYNRLKEPMKLQMDSTVNYALITNGKTITGATSYKDLEEDSPYNTYRVDGLPPGPICSPGKSSIEAALDPDDTDYLYFVLSEKLDGTSYFTDNYEDFMKAANAYGEASRAEESKG
ncbi:MAG: endolytic transglycosylase MltG [Eubacteriales bacterium]|nr:endolytic transglycosylase MltG [Eubacteriales bacterium]